MHKMQAVFSQMCYLVRKYFLLSLYNILKLQEVACLSEHYSSHVQSVTMAAMKSAIVATTCSVPWWRFSLRRLNLEEEVVQDLR